MKKFFILLISLFITVICIAQNQNRYTYPFYIGKVAVSTGSITLYGITSGTAVLRVPSIAGTGTIFQLPANNGTNNYVLKTDGNGVTSWTAQTGGIAPADTAAMLEDYINKADTASMLEHYAKITALNLRLLKSDTASMLTKYATDVNLTYKLSKSDTSAMLAHYAKIVAVGLKLNISDTANMLIHYAKITDLGEATGISASDTANMLTHYSTTAEVRDVIADSLNAIRGDAEDGVALADSVNYDDGYMSRYDGVTGLATKINKLVTDTLRITATTYTFVLADAGRTIRGYHATFQEFTVPLNSSVAFPVGSQIIVKQDGAGPLKFTPASGVVFECPKDSVTMQTRHSWVQLIKRGTNRWELIGRLED